MLSTHGVKLVCYVRVLLWVFLRKSYLQCSAKKHVYFEFCDGTMPTECRDEHEEKQPDSDKH